MATREQFMAMVDPPMLRRLDALRIVMGVSRAEVNRQALERNALKGLERENHARLERLQRLAEGEGVRWEAYVQNYVRQYRQGGPTLEELEQEAKSPV